MRVPALRWVWGAGAAMGGPVGLSSTSRRGDAECCPPPTTCPLPAGAAGALPRRGETMRPPRAPLVLLLLLAAERTARGTFPEEPGPITVAPEDCECLRGTPHGRVGGLRVPHTGVGGDGTRRGEGSGMGWWVLGCSGDTCG